MDCRKELSIIIPVYKTEKYLSKCLDSVLKAIDNRMEVLIINDGSPDHSEEIILRYIEENPNVFQYYKKQNGGLSDVKNYGLTKAKGDFVIFLDSDDYIEPGIYRDMLSKAHQENSDVVVCDIFMDYEDGTPQKRVFCSSGESSSLYCQILDTWVMPASWNKLIRRNLYDGLEFPVGMNNEDVCVTPVILSRARKITIIRTPYYHYFQRNGSIQNGRFNESRFVILDAVKLALERIGTESAYNQQLLKDTLFYHQILAIAMYPIREIDNIYERERLLSAFMERVFELFPDFMESQSFLRLTKNRNPFMKFYGKISLKLLNEKKYHEVSRFWEIYNWCFKLLKRVGLH